MKQYFTSKNILILVISFLLLNVNLLAQETKRDLSKLSKEEALKIPNEEIILMSLEELMMLSNIVGVSVDELMDLSIKSGEKGGFGHQLEDLDIEPYIHGYAAFWYRNFDFNREEDNKTFSMHYFNPIIGVNIKDKIISEIMLEYEHGGNEVTFRYGLIDYSPFDFLTIRAGKFLMPIGKFNEYLYPEHINIFADRPISHWRIIPSVWTEIGVQLRGAYSFTEHVSVNYALFVVNGLEQTDGGYGGDLRSMRNNFRDYSNDNKAFGGRIGMKPIKQIEVGGSVYTGAYSQDGKMGVTISCFDAEFKSKRFAVRGEYATAKQDTLDGSIKKDGFFVEASYRLGFVFEPTIRFEQANLPTLTGFEDVSFTDPVQRLSLGLIIYPEPKLLSRFNVKINYSIIPNDGTGQKRNEFILQTAIGF